MIQHVKLFQNSFHTLAPSIQMGKGFMTYGEKNDFPNDLKSAILSSPTAISCYSTKTSFIHGVVEDVTIETLATDVSSDTTLAEFHHLCASSMAMYDGVAIMVRYNAFGVKVAFDVLPFDSVRIHEVDENGKAISFMVNQSFGSKRYLKKHNTMYYAFNDDVAVVREQMENEDVEFNGQVLFHYVKNAGVEHYPFPEQSASISDMVAERMLSEYHQGLLENGFFVGFMLQLFGDPNEMLTVGDREMTRADFVNQQLSSELQGARNAGKALITWAEGDESRANVVPFPQQEADDLAKFVRETARENIVTAYNIPPILANIQTSGKLGNSQEILNAFKLVNARTERYRINLSAIYTRLFRESIFSSTIPQLIVSPISFEVGEANNQDDEQTID